MEFSLNIFTLNCWGIPGISKNRKERMEAIAKYLSESSHNIVCLQEIWSEADYEFLRDRLKGVLSYSHYFYSGVLGSGLCMFSRWVIQDVFFHQWSLNGYIHKIHHGDWFGGKGVGLCRIKCKDKLINVYCTHLHAEYHGDNTYLVHRVLQAYSTAEFINITKFPADVAILAGDLNAAPGDLTFRIINELPGLQDPFELACEGDEVTVRRASGTCNNANNSYSDRRACEKAPEGKRIDHILFRGSAAWEIQVSNLENPLAERVPNQPFSYSDHNAVALQLRMKPTHGKTVLKNAQDKLSDTRQVLDDAIKVCKEAKHIIAKSRKIYITSGAVIFMLLVGTVGFWPNRIMYDLLKLIATCFCFYYVLMGSLWNQIEMNSLKAGLSGLENSRRSYDQAQM